MKTQFLILLFCADHEESESSTLISKSVSSTSINNSESNESEESESVDPCAESKSTASNCNDQKKKKRKGNLGRCPRHKKRIKTSTLDSNLSRSTKPHQAEARDFISKMKLSLDLKRISKDLKEQVVEDKKEIEGMMERKSSLRNHANKNVIPSSIVPNSDYDDDISSLTLTISSNQYLVKNNKKLKKDLDRSQENNKLQNDAIKVLNSRIKTLESMVLKQHEIIEEKDYLLEAASSVKDKAQKRMQIERSSRLDMKSVAKESNQLKSIMKDVRAYASDLQQDYDMLETEMNVVLKRNSSLSSQLTKKSNKITELEENLRTIHRSNDAEIRRKDRIINRVSNEVRESKSKQKSLKKEKTIANNRLSKITAKKQRVMKQNRSLRRNITVLKERIIKRNEQIKIIAEEKKELSHRLEVILTELEQNIVTIGRVRDERNRWSWPLIVIKVICEMLTHRTPPLL